VNYTWIDAFDANDVTLFDEKGRGCDFTVPEVGDAITFLEKLEALGSGYALSEKDFAKGNVAFQPMLFSEYRAYKSQELSIMKYSGFEWDCVTMPSGPNGDNNSRLDILSIAMSENTAQKDMAWEFMKLLTMDPVIQSEIFDYSAGISVLPQVTQSEDSLSRITRNTGEAFNLEILKSAMEKSVIQPRFRGYENAKEEIGLAVRSILESRSNIRMEQIIWNRTINNYLKSLQINEY
jgi:multiple sugar transport system substrate-binding protein